jgi:hypothetical protein
MPAHASRFAAELALRNYSDLLVKSLSFQSQ